ncbi:hypothetical protein BCR44DRAFT_1426014 [Catenaria anguillulae PL171]|uniref:DUF6604 domain-containing protein n=1 Tax=Catenaria anguillulae PL171 TaxID=765915 RepID=A0A1Y2HZE5_9FUNG|nr:hypothetical protein BCR44DRAFT_1426014 [Catenaria anguillulae PL171]
MQSPQPKLPSFLFDSYKSYKRDTDRLASWLGATAESLGYKHADPPASSTTSTVATDHGGSSDAKPGRLKGKARKAAKDAKSSTKSPSAIDCDPEVNPPAVTTLLSTSQFVKLARFIVDCKAPLVTVPPRIIEWAARAIQARRRCATWFQSDAVNLGPTAQSSCGDSDPAKSATEQRNQSHEYFIEILESVISILAKRVGTRSGGGKARHAKPTVDVVESRFSALSINNDDDLAADSDDDSQDDWDMVHQLVRDTVGDHTLDAKGKGKGGSGAKNKPAETRPARREYRLSQDQDKFGFLIVYMEYLNNLLEVRMDLIQVWDSVGSPDMPSMALAGMATMSLMDSVVAAHKVLCAAFPTYMAEESQYRESFFDFSIQLTLHEQAKMAATGVSPLPEYDVSDVPKPDAVVAKWAEATYLSAAAALESLLFAMRTGAVAQSEIEGRRPVPPSPPTTPLVSAWKQDNEGRIRSDYLLLTRLPVVFDMAKDAFPDILPPAPVLEDIKDLIAKDSANLAIPSPTLFGTQVYLDIARRFASESLTKITTTCADIRASLRPIMSTVILFALHDPQFAGNGTHSTDMKRAAIWNLLHFAMPWWRPKETEAADAFMAMHPWWAGMLVGRAQIVLRDVAWKRMEQDKSVFTAMYLYLAVELGMQARGLIPKPSNSSSKPKLGWWPLMDQLIEALGMRCLFHGREPSTILDLWKSFMEEMGISGVDLNVWAAAQRSSSSGRQRNLRRSGKFAPFQLRPKLMNALSRPARFYLYRYGQEEISMNGLVEILTLIGTGLALGRSIRFHEPIPPKSSASPDQGADLPNSTGTSKQQQQSLPNKGKSHDPPPTFSSFFSHIRSELVSNAPLALHNSLLLHAQACRVMSYLGSALFPLLTRIISQDKDPFAIKGEQSDQLFALLTAMVDTDGSDAAALIAQTLVIDDVREKWRVLEMIFKMVKERVVEIVADDAAEKYDLSDFVLNSEE